MSNESLQAFDYIIQQIRNVNIAEAEHEVLKARALCCIINVAGAIVQSDEDIDNEALKLLDRHERIDNKKLVAICFLRLLSEPTMKWLSEPPWRPKVINLLDSQFSEELYSPAKIDINALAHEKVYRLAEAVINHERSFDSALQLLTSLDRMNAHSQKLMQVLNSKIGRVLMHPFLPNGIEAKLGELYQRVGAYLEQRDGLGIVNARMRATEEIEQLIQALNTKNTLYGQRLSEGFCYKILNLVEEDFAANEAAKPAKLTVELTNKKHPLHLVGKTIKLNFILKNEYSGYAYKTKLLVCSDALIKPSTEEVEIGRLAPAANQIIEIQAEVLQESQQVSLVLEVSWHNFDGIQHNLDFSFVAKAQRSDIDWEPLKEYNPYSLDPIPKEQELAGRRDVLNRLIANAKSSSIGSSIIQGQKRVGKTSIAKALEARLEKLNYLVVTLEGGQYVEESARGTVKTLGRRLCEKIGKLEYKVQHITVPAFDNALSPLDEFLDNIAEIIPEKSIIIILDEFDELPQELYTRSELGNSFFLTLRSLSSRPKLGFVLVGAEKMEYIMDCQGTHLNKWQVYSVDYFTRESDWNDYKELVERPVANILEYTEAALDKLHNITAGNPFFTQLVCKYVFEKAVEDRDCHITKAEIEQAIEKAMSANETSRNTFSHFWEDGIVEIDERAATEKSTRRRKLLIALSDELTKQSPVSGSTVAAHPLVKDILSVENDLREFVTRKVLVSGKQDETYDFKVPLFQRWLKGRGIADVIANITDLDAVLVERQQQEKLKVQPQEIVNLVNKWGLYKGLPVTEDKVRGWLAQFSEIREQRAMFTLLEKLHFYSNSFVRHKMTEVHGIVTRNLTRKLPPKESKRLKQSDILVSYLDGAAKSGADFARLYVDEASLYVDNLVEKGKLADTLLAKTETTALVFIDDLVGTGNSAVTYLEEIEAMTAQKTITTEEVTIADIVLERNIKVIFVAIVAFIDGWKKVEECVEKLRIPVQTYVCEILNETDQCFSEKSRVFIDLNQREIARKVAQEVGKQLEKNCPLGYGNLELAVVFERGCPNNSLPILWSESTKPKWVPLFKRS